MRGWVAALVVAASMAPAPGWANDAPAGSGSCSAHTRACYPACWHEWTGSAGDGVTDPPVDGGPCDYRPAAPVTVGGTVPVTVGGTVPVEVTNAGRIPVEDQHAASGAVPATEVVLAGNGGSALVDFANTVELGLGLVAFAAFAWVGLRAGAR